MLKKTITYTDFNENEVTEDFYFNYSKAELIEMETSANGSLAAHIKGIIDSNDQAQIIQFMKRIVLDAYGRKSDDGKRFVKNPELREEFVQSPAYSDIFMELATNDAEAAEFIKGLLPKGLLTDEDVAEAIGQRLPTQDHQKPRQSIPATIMDQPDISETKSTRELQLEAELAKIRSQE